MVINSVSYKKLAVLLLLKIVVHQTTYQFPLFENLIVLNCCIKYLKKIHFTLFITLKITIPNIIKTFLSVLFRIFF